MILYLGIDFLTAIHILPLIYVYVNSGTRIVRMDMVRLQQTYFIVSTIRG